LRKRGANGREQNKQARLVPFPASGAKRTNPKRLAQGACLARPLCFCCPGKMAQIPRAREGEREAKQRFVARFAFSSGHPRLVPCVSHLSLGRRVVTHCCSRKSVEVRLWQGCGPDEKADEGETVSSGSRASSTTRLEELPGWHRVFVVVPCLWAGRRYLMEYTC
jgi:hypothetical protein